MPRRENRRRKALARYVTMRDDFNAAIEGRFSAILVAPNSEKRIEATDEMIDLLNIIAASDLGLWPFSDKLCQPPIATSNKECREDIETTFAMIAQIVNRDLAACTPYARSPDGRRAAINRNFRPR